MPKKKVCDHKTDDIIPRAYFKHWRFEFLALYCCECDEIFLVAGSDVRDEDDKEETD